MLTHIASPKSKSKITNVDGEMTQMNAVDIRIKSAYRINSEDSFVIDEQTKKHRSVERIDPNEDGFFEFEGGGTYQIEFDHYVEIAEGEAGWIIPRSTLNRNGIFLTSGLYDSGFSNTIGAVLHNRSGVAFIAENTRVGQFVLANAETLKLYVGEYNG